MQNINIYQLKYFKILLILFVLFLTSCKKLVEIDAPFTSTNELNIYSNDATAASVLTGIYTNMSLQNNPISTGSFTNMAIFPSLSADELTLWDNSQETYLYHYTNDLKSLLSLNVGTVDYWYSCYSTIFVVNSAIEGLEKSTGLTPSVKQQLLGEAKFMRAFCYFYLVNYFGDVPIVTTTNWRVNSSLGRVSKDQVFQLIVSDLKDAKAMLNTNYLKADALGTTTERTRPNKWAATALLARTYLFVGDWKNAEIEASEVISNSVLFSLTNLDNVFLKNSTEAIWQLQPVGTDVNSNTGEGYMFILPSSGPSSDHPFYLSNNIVNSFETGDLRKAKWVNSVKVGTITYYYPYKYKIGADNTSTAEYVMVFRLAEQYLIRAEAKARQGNVQGGITDLNSIRNRAGLPDANSGTQTELINAIQKERIFELFTEWGDRWFNLKRTGTIDAVMNVVTPQKGGTWNTNWQLYPIPISELAANPNLVQNSGY